MPETREPNRNEAARWNETSGPVWAELQDVLDRMFAPFEARLVAEAFPREGGRVLDVGCGAGATTLAMARRLGPTGLCLGVDISAPLVTCAKERAEAEGLVSASFLRADAQTHAFEPHAFDAVMSRFGVMFFDDNESAFANIRRAARPRAKMTFFAWRSLAENPFMAAAPRAAAPFLTLPPSNPDAPGQFAFADADKVRRFLDASGWTDIEVAPVDVPTTVAEKDLFAYASKLGPVGAALRDADEPTRARTVEAVRAAFVPFVQEGAARFMAACWLVTARA